MDPFAVFKWLGACAEPSIEEAQPAWWLELQRAEALNAQIATKSVKSKENEIKCNYTQRQIFDGKAAVYGHLGVAAEPRCYETESEFVISKKIQKRGERLIPEQKGSWDLSELDDLERMRKSLLPPIIESSSQSLSKTFSSSDSSCLFDSNCDSSLPSDEESVFHDLQQNSSDSEITENSPFM